MKHSFVYLFVIVVFMGCKKEGYKVPKPAHLNGFVTGIKNGVIWQADISATSWQDSLILLNIAYYDTINWFLLETMTLANLPKQEDKVKPITSTGSWPYPNTPAGSFGYWFIDVIYSGLYPKATDTTNYVMITEIDTISGKIVGDFDLRFFTDSPHPEYPDTLVEIKNGHFETNFKYK
jgi:hypothetical protein